MRAERISKFAIAAWAVIAVCIEFYYASPGWAGLRLIGPVLLASAVAASLVDRRLIALVAAAPYLFPAVLYSVTGEYHVHYSIAWLAAMLGFILPDAFTHSWHVPRRWRAALACWAGVVAVTAPIIALRSVDLRWELLTRARLPHEALGGLTYQSLGWIGHVSLLLVIGILWFDWLCSVEEGFFIRWVVAPLAAGSLGLALTSAWQMLVDIQVANPTVYASLGRATGTLFDANVAGAVAALWVGGWTLVGLRATGRRWLLAAPAVPLLWTAVWASGSRTAFASALIITLCAVGAVLRKLTVRPRVVLSGAVVAVVLLGAGITVLSRSQSTAVGPFARFRAMSPRGAAASPTTLVAAMWNRDGYGLAANRMIAAYPAFGVGVGAFHEMAQEFFVRALPADNAQNWYRHQLAETGIVGSLGWIAFVLSFGWWVVRPHRAEPPAAWVARGMLIALALVSLVGMPAQDPAVAITLWTVAAWYLFIAGRPEPVSATPRWVWPGVCLVIIVAGAGTARLAAGPLRVPVRIQHSLRSETAEYSYGFWPPEVDDEGDFRWAGTRATTVIPVTGRVLNLTASVNFADLAEHPTQAKVWVDGRLVLDGRLTTAAPSLTKSVFLRDGEQRVLIETWANRSVRALPPDRRDLALMLRWRFSSR